MNKKKVSKIIAYVLLAAVLIMTAGLVLTFTRGGTTSFKTFYAEHNGKKLFGDEKLSLVPGEELRFDVKYTFDALVDEEEKDYSVSIITYGTKENQFTYTANGQPFGFDATTEVDVSDYFNLKKEEDHFTMELPNNFSMAAVLSQVHEGKTIEVAKSVDISAGWYFAMKIQSYNEESTIIVPFRQAPEEFDIDFSLKGVKADRKNPKVALSGYNETELRFSFEDGFGPEGLYVLVERCGSFDYTVDDGELIVTITDPGPGVKVTVTAIQQTYKLVADELVGVEPVQNNPDTIEMGKSALLTFQLKEGYELSTYDALGGTIQLEKQDGNTLVFKLSYEPEDYGDIHYCIYATPGDGASFPVEVVYTTGAITPSPANPQKVPVNGNAQLIFTVNSGYIVGNVIATGAEVEYEQSGQILTVFVTEPAADVVVVIETRPAYDITTNTTGVIENASNPTKLVDGSNAILYFSPMTGYALPETVIVTNASYQWDQSTGKLELRDPAGPITVTVVAVKGEAQSYAITTSYNAGHITPYFSNVPSIQEGTTVHLQFTITTGVNVGSVNATGATISHSISGQLLTVTLENPTGPVTVTIDSRPFYKITTNLSRVSADSSNPSTITDGTAATLYFTARSGYSLPDTVTVTNAEYQWTQATGRLVLRDPIGPVTITITGVEILPEVYEIQTIYTPSHFVADASNPATIEQGTTAQLKFTIASDVDFGTVTATGATVSHSVSGQLLTVTLKNPTGPVKVTMTSRPVFSINTVLSNLTAASDNPGTIIDGFSATLYFTANDGYSLPDTITVINAGYQWTKSTGKLVLRDPTGPITVTVTGVEILPEVYDIQTIYTPSHFVADASNPTTIEEGATVQLKFTIADHVDFGSVSAIGAAVSHSVSGQVLTVTLNNPVGPVTVTMTSRPTYDITVNLSHVSAASSNADKIIDGLPATLYFTADSGYSLPATVTVTNARYEWNQSTGKLLLRDPTGPVTVSIVGAEIVANSYPITVSYNSKHMTAYSTNVTMLEEGATAAMRFTILANVDFGTVTATGATVSHSVSGQLLTVTLKNPTGPVTVTITSRPMYKIATNLSYVSAVSGNPTTITDGTAVTLYFTARTGYSLPASVDVTNAGHTWDQATGKLVLRDPTGPVTVTVVGVSNSRPTYAITTNLTNVTANAGNDTTLTDSSNAILYFTAKTGYLLPDTVSVDGARYEWNQATGKLELRDPTGPITVTVVGIQDPNARPAFDIQVTMIGVLADVSNPTVIYDNSSATLYFTARNGYYLPATVTVSGAGYQWDQSTGKLVLRDPAGPVTVEVCATPDSGYIPYEEVAVLPVEVDKKLGDL